VYTVDKIASVDTISHEVSTRDLRGQLSEVLGRAMYGHERIGVTRNGKLAAVVLGVDDLELLEELEMAQDVVAYRAAKEQDDGTRVSLSEQRGSTGS
jgi:prevent-host-death family protein